MNLKTIEQWEKVFDTKVMDGDGFPRGTNKKVTLFSEKEFLENCRISTVQFSETLLKAWNKS